MPRHKFLSRVLFNISVMLLTRRGDYSSISYSTMSLRNRIGFSHKSGTGHHSKKRQCSVISAIPGRRPHDRNILFETPMLHTISPDKDAVMAVADQYHQPVVYVSSKSSRGTVTNVDYVHSTLSSI